MADTDHDAIGGEYLITRAAYEGDIVTRLRRWTHAVDAAPASDLMDDAADEIGRLRGDAEVSRLRLQAAHSELLRLTDAEREAIEWFAGSRSNRPPGARATLRGLLDRLK